MKQLNDIVSFCRQLHIEAAQDVPLSDYTTFRLGGRCPLMLTCGSPQQIEALVPYLDHRCEPFILIGGGSNILVSDRGIDCIVIRYYADRAPIETVPGGLSAAACARLDDVVLFAAEQGLAGMNFLSGICGTVGGGVAGNAGAFGKQIGDCLASVVLLRADGRMEEAGPEALGFGYRHSSLKSGRDIIVSVKFALRSGNRAQLLKERKEILDLRREKHPDVCALPSAGSFFRNVDPTSSAQRRQAAGWFLERAGADKIHSGGAFVCDKHANIIVKGRNGTAQDVFDLSRLMAARVKESFGLDLVREVRLVGDFDGSDGPHDTIW